MMVINRHLTREEILKLKKGILPLEDKCNALAHISQCSHCADALAGNYESRDLLSAPPDFISESLTKIEQLPKSIAGSRIRNRKRELYFYGFKVSVAACIALVLLFSGTFNYGITLLGESRIAEADFSKVNIITENLRGFSDKLIHIQVIDRFGGGI
ncbi:hypothetical protein [Sinanaerobacter chloroacetimidivorans]|uniref:Zinc-finger domain-containing protein n=1 Tax=Sinanaerobacter chloroacetimidivorans TaxID=2818044 RepID=A0A8J7W0S0_9FIRM|nr:hypothetical protein [Sinanaerobacter chloroacetimidivorans]MBR0597076.1 hypothetical protein [Sinanaerobacter chloroacetimidivorans]